jgi:Protein of unknown function (DUF3052)
MVSAGYSGTPLPAKLGIKSGHTIAILAGPDELDDVLVPLPDDLAVQRDLTGEVPLDVVLLFVTERAVLADRLASVRARMASDGGFWVAWPKKASRVPTDMTEDVVREVALPTGLVDNKVCAIDATWSGLRLVIRRELR